MSTVKVFKRGEILYKEGEKVLVMYLIQSGSVNLFLSRQKNNVDLFTAISGQIVGDHALWGAATHPHSAVAMGEVKAVELPVEGVKGQLETSSQLQKFLTKSFCDKMKLLMRDLQSVRLSADNTPCPPDQTAKIFGALFHTARTKGESLKEGGIKVSWLAMKQYAQRVFGESPKRLEMTTNVFVKLGAAKYTLGKPDDNPDGPDEILSVTFSDLPLVEQFFEFYQFYYFKGGKQDLLKTDERVMGMAQCLIDLGSAEKPDRHNIVNVDYAKVIEKFKMTLGVQLNNDHWSLIEGKGLYVKRQSNDKGITLQFDLKEFSQTARTWKVLREVERWNEKGSVDPHEPVEIKKESAKGPGCPACGHGYESLPKFCSECGHKFTSIVSAA
jgi:hypothetical protein